MDVRFRNDSCLLYFILLFFVPKSPRWLFGQNRNEEGKAVLERLHVLKLQGKESQAIIKSIQEDKSKEKVQIGDYLSLLCASFY